MDQLLSALIGLSAALRSIFLVIGVVLAVVATMDWAVRARKLNPFGGIARFVRANVDPRLAGVERQVMRMGGHATATPWWGLVLYVVMAALALAGVDVVAGLIREALIASTIGGLGILYLLVRWTFAFLRFALLIRVLSSWFPRMAYSRWIRWSFGVTEWMLRPLRAVIPSIGLVDITPIVAYFALQLLQKLVESAMFPGLG
ncbi:MAG: YggT family protein [Polaromonas sp.]|nr:YggT family protein [Gemmatimonadaceae bacterium]